MLWRTCSCSELPRFAYLRKQLYANIDQKPDMANNPFSRLFSNNGITV